MSAATKAKAARQSLSLNRRNTLVGLSFIIPNFIGFAVFTLIPVAFSFALSFMQWDGFTEMEFVGLQNFVSIFDDKKFVQSVFHTFYFAFFTVVLSAGSALGLALLLNRKLKFLNFFRSAIFFPHVASMVAVSCVWKAMFMEDGGVINTALSAIGVAEEFLPGWIASTKWAMISVILVGVWRNMGYFMVIYLAALQDIPQTLYEAARIDGASKWQQFRRITLPMLTPCHFFVIMMLTIGSFKTFDLVYLMTEGGPGTATQLLSMYVYNKAFISWDYGATSAASMILFLLVATITVLQFRVEKKFNDFM